MLSVKTSEKINHIDKYTALQKGPNMLNIVRTIFCAFTNKSSCCNPTEYFARYNGCI